MNSLPQTRPPDSEDGSMSWLRVATVGYPATVFHANTELELVSFVS